MVTHNAASEVWVQLGLAQNVLDLKYPDTTFWRSGEHTIAGLSCILDWIGRANDLAPYFWSLLGSLKIVLLEYSGGHWWCFTSVWGLNRYGSPDSPRSNGPMLWWWLLGNTQGSRDHRLLNKFMVVGTSGVDDLLKNCPVRNAVLQNYAHQSGCC